ncbi:MAG TPA: phosphoribosyl-AMP cyclohydrolase [Syntrophorhabdaceae bacterium]|nr:phosphoribosyl-AMP cyclohydrolase [Syntrophorhabdaceae bacterium]
MENEIKWDEKGLVPVVAQDYQTKDVLMVAYMDRQALRQTLETGKAHYYSRSRKKIWFKGEESGHTQDVKGIYVDCDNDTILIMVDQKVAACHTGFRSCFYRIWDEGWKVIGEKIFDAKKVYGDSKKS